MTTFAAIFDTDSEPVRFICKTCGGPSPLGVGYTATGAQAAAASVELDQCPCGESQAAR